MDQKYKTAALTTGLASEINNEVIKEERVDDSRSHQASLSHDMGPDIYVRSAAISNYDNNLDQDINTNK